MSASPLKVFMFTAKTDGRVLSIKKSNDGDFRFDGEEWLCTEIRGLTSFAAPNFDQLKWSAETGFEKLPHPDESGREPASVTLLKKKIQTLLSLRATLAMIWRQVATEVSIANVKKSEIHSDNWPRIAQLLFVERKQMKRKINVFFDQIKSRIEACKTIEDVNLVYEDISNNVTLGGYTTLGPVR